MTKAQVHIKGGSALIDEGHFILSSSNPTGDGVVLRREDVVALPFDAASLDSIVITETLEFLDPGALFRLLLEVHRVLKTDGRLILEIPDFEELLADWTDDQTLAQFCTYQRSADAPGVWRTPEIDSVTLGKLRRSSSPMQFAIGVVNLVIDGETRCRFGRQSAWDRGELAATLNLVGFEMLSYDETMVEQLSKDSLITRAEGHIRCFAAPALSPAQAGDVAVGTGVTEAMQCFTAGVAHAYAGRHDKAMRLLKKAIGECPSLGESQYRLVWDLYTRAIRATAGTKAATSPTFMTEGRHIGHINDEVVTGVRIALNQAPIVRLTADDAAPGYLANPNLTSEAEATINNDNSYLLLEPSTLASVRPLFEALADSVEACLGTPFRIVNLRAWRTEANARRVEANGWHRDEPYPTVVLKVIVYLTEAGADTGSTEIVHSDGTHSFAVGPAGTFLVFQNSELIHRGFPPTRGTRSILEVTVTPHTTRDLRPVCAGTNADFPFSPWLAIEPWMVPKGLCQ